MLGSKEIKQQIERDREERKRKESKGRKIGGDLCRTDYSTLNRVFGWNIGIRGRKPTQSDTQGYGMEEGERDTCVGRGVLPSFVARYLFSSLPLPILEGKGLMLQAHKGKCLAYISISSGKIVGNFPLYPPHLLTLYIYIYVYTRSVASRSR